MNSIYAHRKPLVSVLMPVYNQEEFVGEAIQSVLDQTFEDWELVIGDDCSSDQTYEISRSYQKEFPGKIQIFANESNLGITQNCNKILGKCQGRYIAFFAGDDVFLPSKIEKQVRLMENERECVLSYHNVEVFESGSGAVLFNYNQNHGSKHPISGRSDVVATALVAKGNRFMAAQSVVARRECIPRHGFDAKIPVASDWLMWIECCALNKGKIVYIDEVLARYRRHQNNVTNISRSFKEDEFVTLALVENRYFWLRDAVRRKRGSIYYREAIELLLKGNSSFGRKLLLLGSNLSLSSWKVFGWFFYSFILDFRRLARKRNG